MHHRRKESPATRTGRGQDKQTILEIRTWQPVVVTLVLLGALVFLDEIIDLPHLFMGAEPTPINWPEAFFETAVISFIVVLAVSRLIGDTIKLNQAQEEIAHLNLSLRAIRGVNQLIDRERDRDRLLQGICETLIETHSYYNTWIALLDESKKLLTSAESGLGENFLPLVERLKRGELTDCGRRTLIQSELIVVEDPISDCADCPLSTYYADHGAMAVQLKHGEKVYGILCTSVPARYITSEEERILIKEVADDIAFALHNIEIEEALKEYSEQLEEMVEVRTAKLKESERLLSITLMSIGDAVIATDARGLITFMNPIAENLTGWYESQAIGKPLKRVFNIINEQTGEQAENPVDRVLREGIVVGLANHTVLIAKDGTQKPIADSGAPIRDEEGKIVGAVMVFLDVTERKKMQEHLAHAEKLALLGKLTGGIAHELRNPLGVISNAIYYLQAALPDPDEKIKEYLELIALEVDNSTKIINDMLDVSRTIVAQREATVVSELVTQVLEWQPPPEGLEVTTEMPDDLPQVFVDPRQIGQVMVNLVRNAYQAMPEGGKLTIRASSKGKELFLSVSDTGCGISKDNMKKLFEPLFTTKERGIGLGLVVSKNLVEANGGMIRVVSKEGEGSTFTIVLPIQTDAYGMYRGRPASNSNRG